MGVLKSGGGGGGASGRGWATTRSRRNEGRGESHHRARVGKQAQRGAWRKSLIGATR